MSAQVSVSSREDATKRPSLTRLIFAGLALGLAWGLFFGEYGGWVQWIGDAYVGLLQMTVLPYVAVSLTCNIGRLSASHCRRVARVVIILLLVLWGVGFLTLGVMALSFPPWKAGSFFSTSLVETPPSHNWLDLFIPSNPFFSLANNLVPAVVLFSLGLGVALIPVANKAPLLAQLDVWMEGLGRLNKFVVNLSPIGIFAIVGHASGTLSWTQFGLLQGYLLAYGAASLLLSLCILPMLIACCTPISFREVLRASRDALLTAFIIGNTFAVLPMIVEAVRQMLGQRRVQVEDATHAPAFLVPLAYPFPDLGRIVGLLFIPFAAWFYGREINPASYPELWGVGFVGAFAKPVVTMPLLLNLAELPSDIFNLYLAAGVIASRFGDLMKTMHVVAFSVLAACSFSGVIRLDVRKLLLRVGSTVVLFAAMVCSIRGILSYSFVEEFGREDLIRARKLQFDPVQATIKADSSPHPQPLGPGEDPLDRIRRLNVIRIGVDADELPFCYYNDDGELVGFDVDMAHQLARDLNVKIEFVPFRADVPELLRADHFDIAMSALEGTLKRAVELPHVQPYLEVTVALVVPDHQRGRFRSLKKLREDLRAGKRVRLAVVADSRASEVAPELLIGAGESSAALNLEVVELASEGEFFESRSPVADALVTSAEAGSAWTLKYPQFSVVKPSDADVRLPLYYLVAGESQLEEFLENWLELKRRNGTIDQLYDYWILGHDAPDQTPRWCVLRDVLQWVD